jgi:hypothetical protein
MKVMSGTRVFFISMAILYILAISGKIDLGIFNELSVYVFAFISLIVVLIYCQGVYLVNKNKNK